ncbi:MAG: hypothetical protein EHM79_06740 [Geobacter sp.]|nr:MAG: hypothetical protein EHM79_06740 [Geobacter sp.]
MSDFYNYTVERDFNSRGKGFIINYRNHQEEPARLRIEQRGGYVALCVGLTGDFLVDSRLIQPLILALKGLDPL